MTRHLLRGSSAVGIGVMLLVGVVRTQNRAEEREAAVRKLCEAESGSGGGAAPAAGGLAGRFGIRRPTIPTVIGQGGGGGSSSTSGTPEIKLEALASAAAGNVINLTVKGKFEPGTHFVFGSDAVQVVSEKVSANSYEARLRVAQTSGPAVIEVQAFAPRTCGASALVPAVVVGGKYAWDLTGSGWKLQLRSDGAGLAQTSDGKFQETYSAEFFRNAETMPFSVRKATLAPVGEGLYAISISNPTTEGFGIEEMQATQERIMKRMSDPTISDAEKEKLSAEFSAAMDKFAAQSEAAAARTNVLFTCSPGSLKWDGKAAQAKLECSTGELNLTGTMRTLR